MERIHVVHSVYEPLMLHTNLEIGKDHKDLNRGVKVEVGNDDMQRREFTKGVMQPSTNMGNNVDVKDQLGHRPITMKREAQSIANLIQVGKAKMKKIGSS